MRNKLVIFFVLMISTAYADNIDTRAKALYHDLRCMVCGGQSLAESNAELAVGMRQMIREKLEAGESEAAIKTYLTERYGDEILMQPPLRAGTAFIWFLPLLLLAGGVIVILRYKKRAQHA